MTMKRVGIDQVSYTIIDKRLFIEAVDVLRILEALQLTKEEIDHIEREFESLKWEF